LALGGSAFAATMACVLLAVLAPALSRPASDKKPGSGSHKLLAVTATGTARYDDQAILAASGLELGQPAAEGDLQEAAERLGNSGLFSEVRYSFSYSDAGVKVEFQLTDVDGSKLVPMRFENFVWFTEPELRKLIAQRVPLFKETLPANGRLTEQISKALQGILEEKHLPGRVDYLSQGKLEGGDVIGIVYRVLDLTIRIRNVEFPGASAEEAAFLAAGGRKLAGAEYSRSKLATVAQYDLLPLFLERGYLKAEFGPADARVVASSEDRPPDDVEVDAIVPVRPGRKYSVSEVSWKGNSAITTLEAAPFFHLTEGEPANAVRLEHDAEELRRLYRSRGYMKASVAPEAHMEDEKSTVHYVIAIAEGDLYRMGEIEFLGVDSASKDRLHEAWNLREGQPYNADYMKKFLLGAPRLLPKGLDYSMKVDEELNAKDKTVDVTVHFKAK